LRRRQPRCKLRIKIRTAEMASLLDVDEIVDGEMGDDFWQFAFDFVVNFVPRRPRVFRCGMNPLWELDDTEFRVRFRLTKELFCQLLHRIEPDLKHSTDSHGGLSPLHQLAVALRFYASGSFLVRLHYSLLITPGVACVNFLVSMQPW